MNGSWDHSVWSNDGVIINTGGGGVNISGAVGTGASVNNDKGRSPVDETHDRAKAARDLGVITIISEEAKAVIEMLRRGVSCDEYTDQAGRRFDDAVIEISDRHLRFVHLQSLKQGPSSAALAVRTLLDQYSPAVVALTGIAGGIHPDVRVGDVVIGEEIINYDSRKEIRGRVLRRGSGQQIPAPTRHAVNRFFASHGEPCRISAEGRDGVTRTFGVFHGPIGTGSKVIASRHSRASAFVRDFNYKALAVETEAEGFAWTLYEAVSERPDTGWLVVRGISDLADARKADTHHDVAAWHAAVVLEQLSPDLIPER